MSTVWDLCCSPSKDSLATFRNVYLREAGGLWNLLGGTPGCHFRTQIHDELLPYEFAFAEVTNGVEANEEDWIKAEIVPASTTDFELGTPLTFFNAAQVGQTVCFRWSSVLDPNVERVEIRGSYLASDTSWDDCILIASVPAALVEFVWNWWASGVWRFRLKTITKQGLESTDLVTSVTILKDEYFVQQGSSDESGGGFAGTKADLSVSGGNLEITAVPATASCATATASALWPTYLPHKGTGTYVTAVLDAGLAVYERIEVGADVALTGSAPATADFLAPYEYRDPADPRTRGAKGPARLLRSTGAPIQALGIDIEIAVSTSDSTPDSYERWVPGAIYYFRYVRLRVTLSSIGYFKPSINQLIWSRHRRNLKDEGSGTSNSADATGTEITFAQIFTTIPSVVVTPTRSGATYIEVVSGSTTATTFKVKAYDSSGARVTATFNWIAAGV